jgi:hypothetical protein
VSKFAAQTSRLTAFAWCSVIVNQRREKLILALAMAGLATQVYALFAVAVALGGPRTPPGPANPFLPTARAAKTLRGACAAIWP